MRVIMPWATIYPEAIEAASRSCLALWRSGWAALAPELFYVGERDTDYAELLWSLWAHPWRRPATLVIIEHDIVVGEAAVGELLRCRHRWCAFPYLEVPDSQPVTGLGCTKIEAELIARLPNPFATAELPHWRNVDYMVGSVLRDDPKLRHPRQVHVHQPPVRNLSVEP